MDCDAAYIAGCYACVYVESSLENYRVEKHRLKGNEPVEAVMATASADLAYFFRRVLIISHSRTDFPVPIGYTGSKMKNR